MKKSNILPRERLFMQSKGRLKVNWTKLFEHLFVEGTITKEDAKQILLTTNSFLESEPNLLYLQDPVTLVGDIHGEIFRLGGNPESTKYLFLGDYVDRGIYAVEVILTIYALKINFPNTIFLLRGNHECRQMTAYHYFREECLQKFDQEIYDLMIESFDRLPIAAVINGQFLALHGGISPDLKSCLEINQYNRFQEPPQVGTLCDILWSDPVDNNSGLQKSIWEPNNSRGCSYYFGFIAINEFLRKNNLISIIRAHEAQYEGFKAYVWQNSDFPQVITLFSAPNYCGTYANKGAILKLSNNEMKVIQYNFTPKPDILLHLGDAFSWSVPLISKALMDMFIGFLSYTNDQVLDHQKNTVDISMLDNTVLEALDIKKEDAQNKQNNEYQTNFLEQLVEQQKQKKKLSNKDLIQGFQQQGIQVQGVQQNADESLLNETQPDVFDYRKYEDKYNEKRPTKQQFNYSPKFLFLLFSLFNFYQFSYTCSQLFFLLQ